MMRNFKSDDEGKRVLTAEDEVVGTVTRVERGHAYVTPDEGLSTETRQRFGWHEGDAGPFRLRKAHVERVVDDDIQLKDDV
jgi:hypothetical protein